jgi:long-chain acyl-CoA synthetase
MAAAGSRGILLTGATGFVGGDLLPRLLAANPDARIHCLIRARDREHLEQRRLALLQWAEVGEDDQGRVVAHPGQIERSDLGLGEHYARLASDVDEIYHVAASTKFDLPIEDARRINRDSAAHVLEFARGTQDAGGLRRVHHVSTAYVAGGVAGVLSEDAVDRPEFRNTYEQSKCEAEQLLAEARDEIPITVYRPSIVVGDSVTGRTLHFRVLYDPMKWVYFGKTNVLPCRPEVRMDVVPINFVCDALLAIGSRADSEGGTYHLTAGPAHAISIADMIRIALEVGNRYHEEIGGEPLVAPRVVSPDALDDGSPEDREQLAELMELGEAVMRTHVPYMLTEQLFDSTRAHTALAGSGIECPNLGDYFDRICRWAVERNFGDS